MATDFRELRVWEEAMVLTERVYEVVRGFPGDERFGLPSQLKRAAVSMLLQAMAKSLGGKSSQIAAPHHSPFPVPRSRS